MKMNMEKETMLEDNFVVEKIFDQPGASMGTSVCDNNSIFNSTSDYSSLSHKMVEEEIISKKIQSKKKKWLNISMSSCCSCH